MRRYVISYRDQDPGCPVFRAVWRAYSAEHAEERFWESSDGDDGWQILSVTLHPEERSRV